MTGSVGAILLGHPVCDTITEAEMVSALPDALGRDTRRCLLLGANRMPLADLAEANWAEAQRKELDQFNSQVKPVLTENPDASVCYFGLAPIPVAMYLGYLFGTTRALSAFQKHHVSQKWQGTVPPPGPRDSFAQVIDDLSEVIAASGEAIIRVSVSYEVEKQATLAVVPEPLAEVDVRVPIVGPDSTHDSDALESVAIAFRTALDRIKHYRPNTTLIHVFASVPVGVAFKLGARVSPTIHPEVMTYQFVNRGDVKYRPAFTLHLAPQSNIILNEDERKLAASTRSKWSEEVKLISSFTGMIKPQKTAVPGWLESLFPGIVDTLPLASAFPNFSCLSETELPSSRVSDAPASAEDGFSYSKRDQAWHFSDELLHTFNRQFNDEAELRRAGRLLVLHEAVHISDHGLTEATAPRIGRFPKLLEEADYYADVWGFLHEFRLARNMLDDKCSIRQLFTSIIETALKSFWAFDDTGRDQTEIQIRRMHRYLNWYWQALHMEGINSEAEALQRLLLKPQIEVAGPDIRAAGDRVFYPLQGKYGRAELAVMHENRIFRFGDGNASQVVDIFEGFRRRSSEQIRSALKGVFDQVVQQKRR